MKNLVKFLGVCLFLVSITFAAEAEEKKWSKMKPSKVYDSEFKAKIGTIEVGYREGFQGILYECKFAPFAKCDTDKQRFESKDK